MGNVKKSMIVVGGSKGGVGKTLVCMGVLDWIHCARREPVLLIDGDNTNPDVYKTYERELEPDPRPLNLKEDEGWLLIADACEQYPDAHIVINTGAGYIDPILQYSPPVMVEIASKLQRPVIMLWVIDDKRDSVELLRRYIDEMPAAARDATRLHVVCNEDQEEGRSFEYYHSKKTARLVADGGGKTVVIPRLAKRATTLLYTERRPIRVVAEGDAEDPVPFGTRIEMSRWRRVVWEILETLGLDEG